MCQIGQVENACHLHDVHSSLHVSITHYWVPFEPWTWELTFFVYTTWRAENNIVYPAEILSISVVDQARKVDMGKSAVHKDLFALSQRSE